MQTLNKNSSSIKWIFSASLLLFILSWTILPAIIRHELPPDLIEAYIWGHPFSWGNDKNPWLPAAIANLGIALGGTSGIGIYFLQSLTISIGLVSIYKLITKLSNAFYGFIAATSLMACIAYSIELQIYNDNYILMGLLPLATLFFYEAVFSGKTYYWILAGAILGLSTMGKYHSILLGASLFCFIIFSKNHRHYLATYKPYLAFLIFFLVITPNLIWLAQHDFMTWTYAFHERANYQKHEWSSTLVESLDFLYSSFLALFPAFFLILTAYSKQRASAIDREKRTFLFWMALGPLLILFVLSLVLNLKLHREWGTGLLGLIPSYFFIRWMPQLTLKSLKRYTIFLFAVLILYPSVYVYVALHRDTGNFPVKAISQHAEKIWEEHFHTKLSYVAGDRYTAGYLALHGKDKPMVWMEWNERKSPNISVADLKCKGALFIISDGHTPVHRYAGMQFPDFILKEFPTLEVLPPMAFPWYRPHKDQKTLSVTIGLLAPSKADCQ